MRQLTGRDAIRPVATDLAGEGDPVNSMDSERAARSVSARSRICARSRLSPRRRIEISSAHGCTACTPVSRDRNGIAVPRRLPGPELFVLQREERRRRRCAISRWNQAISDLRVPSRLAAICCSLLRPKGEKRATSQSYSTLCDETRMASRSSTHDTLLAGALTSVVVLVACHADVVPLSPSTAVTYSSPMWYEETARCFQLASDGRLAAYGPGPPTRIYDVGSAAVRPDAWRAAVDNARGAVFDANGGVVVLATVGGTNGWYSINQGVPILRRWLNMHMRLPRRLRSRQSCARNNSVADCKKPAHRRLPVPDCLI